MDVSVGYLYNRLGNHLFNPFWTMIKGKKSILDQFGQSLYPYHHELLRTFYLEQLSMYAAVVIVVFTSQLFLCCTRREGGGVFL
jgi:glutathionylspermidine synthase